MSKLVKLLLFSIPVLFIMPLTFPTLAQDSGPGPAGVPLIEYMFARVVCVTVPLGYTALLVVLVFAGFKYLTSAGEAKAVQAAHQTVTWGLLGVLFLAIAWLILQLIQNFTGVEVTKFNVASLPGVQGFTGSCWAPPPVVPQPTSPPQTSQPPTQPPTQPPIECNHSSEWFKSANSESLVVYRNAEDIRQLKNVLDQVGFISVITDEALDDNIYVREGNSGLWGKYPKGYNPERLSEAANAACMIAVGLDPGIEYAWCVARTKNVASIKECPDADFYPVSFFSPLIYLYPQTSKVVSLKIESSLFSPKLALDKNKSWNVTALPDGTLTTLDGKKHKFIPYEFLRSDFKRPANGYVIEGSKLEAYLKNDLWKKLGLSDSEINDYWWDTKPRIKSSPYYFVSLIDRSEIDRVLPMEVNPKPDTILRNMTYILPLSQSPSMSIIPLEEEKLIAPERKGFTVLENGVFVDGF